MREQLQHSQQARREFLEKAGRFAVYTTPTIVMLMHPSAEAIASGATGKDKDKKDKKDKNKDKDKYTYKYK
jgi:hypothetical protein